MTTSVPRSLANLFPAVFVSEAPERCQLLYMTLQALNEAGGKPAQAWITNEVKHFKFAPKSKRRIHQKAGSIEICAWR